MCDALTIVATLVGLAILMTPLGLLINGIINGGRKWWE